MRSTPWLALAVLIAAAIAAASTSACRVAAAKCAACDRAECKNMVFTIHLSNGKTVNTCCPRCGQHYIESQRPSVASLSVRAFDTAAILDATRALYVDGSNVTPCTVEGSSLPKDERGCCMNPVYDRCLPSLIAFDSRAKAEAFAREHGGIVKHLRIFIFPSRRVRRTTLGIAPSTSSKGHAVPRGFGCGDHGGLRPRRSCNPSPRSGRVLRQSSLRRHRPGKSSPGGSSPRSAGPE